MPLMTYGGASLLVRNGAIGTSVACCCSCPTGTVVIFAWYFDTQDNVEVGREQDWYQPPIDELNRLLYGFDLRAIFWIGNEEEQVREDGKLYYDEFQVWGIAQCCPDRDCDDFYYRNHVEVWTENWDKIRDIQLPQFEWEPGIGAGIDSDAAIGDVYEAAKDVLAEAGDPPSSAFVYRDSIEVCCD